MATRRRGAGSRGGARRGRRVAANDTDLEYTLNSSGIASPASGGRAYIDETQPSFSGGLNLETEDDGIVNLGIPVARIIESQDYPIAPKRPRIEPLAAADNELNVTKENENACTICYDEITSSGTHRLVCLKCGHLFGRSCIERWLNHEKKCPTCKSGAKPADIRNIFGSCTTGSDNSAEVTSLKNKVKELVEENESIQIICETLRKDLQESQRSLADTLKALAEYRNMQPTETETKFKVAVKKGQPFKICMTINPNQLRAMSISTDGEYAAFGIEMVSKRPTAYGICTIGFGMGETPSQKFHAHNSAPRCIHFCPTNKELVASTAEDQTLVIRNIRLNKECFNRRLPDHGWSCCFMSESSVAVGLKSGAIMLYEFGLPDLKHLVEQDSSRPGIFAMSYDENHRILFFATLKGVYAYRNRVETLIGSARLSGFYYDPSSQCFLITVPPTPDAPLKLQLYKVDFKDGPKCEMIGEHVSNCKQVSKMRASCFWVSPMDEFLCAFFDEDRCYTQIISFGTVSAPVKAGSRKFSLKHDKDKEKEVMQYCYAVRNNVPPSITSVGGIQYSLMMISRYHLLTYYFIYE